MSTRSLVCGLFIGLTFGGASWAQEVQAHDGTVVSLNEREGTVVVKTSSSLGTWRVNHETFVSNGNGRQDASALLSAQSVTAYVSRDGVARKILIHGMRQGWATGPNVGEVLMINEREGRIQIRMEHSTGNWTVDRSTRVTFNLGSEPLSLLKSSRKVRVEVAPSGHVEAIQILDLK